MLALGLVGRPGPGPRQAPKYAPVLGTFGGASAATGATVVGATVVVVVDVVLDGAGGAAADSDVHAAASGINSASATLTTDGAVCPVRLRARSVPFIIRSRT